MSDTVTWRGPIHLEAGKAKWSFADRVTLTVKYTGPYTQCLAARPKRGSVIESYSAFGLKVDTSEVEEDDGLSGTLVITLISPEVSDDTVSSDPIGDPIFEVDYNEETKALETHPKCGYLKEIPGLTWDDWATFENNPNGQVYTERPDGWSQSQYIAMKREGIEDYPVVAPVIRRTTYHFYPPGGVGAGIFTRQEPPVGSFAGSGFEWLKGPERLTKQGRLYTRITEWWGAKKINDTLYPNS